MKALKWALEELCRSGDTVHIVYVAKVLSPETTVLHGPVGSSYKYRDNTIEQAKAEIDAARAWLSKEVQPQVEAHAIYIPHLFVDQINAPADVVAHTILKVVEEVAAKYIVLAKSNKVQPAQLVRMTHMFDAEQTTMEKFFVGSVANAVSKLGVSGSITLVA